MPLGSAIILLACFSAETRPELVVEAQGFTARFDAGTLMRLADGDGTQYVVPPEQTVGLGVHTLSGDFHAGPARPA